MKVAPVIPRPTHLLAAAGTRLDGLCVKLQALPVPMSFLDRPTHEVRSMARDLRARLLILQAEEAQASTANVIQFTRDVFAFEKRLEFFEPRSN